MFKRGLFSPSNHGIEVFQDPMKSIGVVNSWTSPYNVRKYEFVLDRVNYVQLCQKIRFIENPAINFFPGPDSGGLLLFSLTSCQDFKKVGLDEHHTFLMGTNRVLFEAICAEQFSELPIFSVHIEDLTISEHAPCCCQCTLIETPWRQSPTQNCLLYPRDP